MEQQKFIEKIESIEIPCRYSLLLDEINGSSSVNVGRFI